MTAQTVFNFVIRLTAKLLAGTDFEAMCDNFCGGGGAGLGMEKGTGHAVDSAANHDEHAIAMHSVNHPNTKHFRKNIWKIEPEEMTEGRPVGLAWFSPDCKHFSKAKGGKPLSHQIRDLAWVVIKWVKKVSPRIIILENVTEFQTWGPLGKDNMPIKARKGETFKRWVRMLRAYGYQVEWRELVAADYGAPTIRKRLYLIARRDGMPIVWPKATHAPRKVAAELRLLQWRSAAECIDWTLPCPSIFNRKKPLAESTQRRIAIGVMRYVLKANDPFIVTVNHQGEGFRGQSVKEPFRTVTGSREGTGVVMPFVSPYHQQKHATELRGQKVTEPLKTLDTQNRHALLLPHLIGIDHNGRGGKPVWDVKKPLNTVTTENRHALISTWIMKHNKGNKGKSPKEPLDTETTKQHDSVGVAFLNKHYTGAVGQHLKKPLGTVTAQDHHSLSVAFASKFRGTAIGSDVKNPMPTVTAGGMHVAEVRAFLVKWFGTSIGQDVKSPAHTLTAKHRLGLVTVHGVDYQIVDIGLRMLKPKELLRAQFGKYADEYILIGSQEQQVKAIGNSVCPEVAEALVRANVKLQKVPRSLLKQAA